MFSKEKRSIFILKNLDFKLMQATKQLSSLFIGYIKQSSSTMNDTANNPPNVNEKMMVLTRLVPYWLTVVATCWTLFYFYIWNTTRTFNWFVDASKKVMIAIQDDVALEWADGLLGFMTPLLLVACMSTLLLTNEILPAHRLSWFNKLVGYIRRFRIMDAEHGVALYKKNQFGVGQVNFNLMSFWLIFIPGMILFVTYIHNSLKYARDPESLHDGVTAKQHSVEYISYLAGWVGTVLMSFFLIPVSRHSVLLVAMNWSPVHALRIHIWAGYLAFFFIFLHAIMIVGIWFKWAPGAIYEEFIPPKSCWKGTYPEESRCSWQFYNFTGTLAMIFLTILWVSSFEWFRRKWYRIFYILHVVFGTLTMVCSIWHFEFIGLYWLPSILYYLASTMPTLVQALASRFRGGVKISQVMDLVDAGNCLEIRATINQSAQANLANSHPSKYIKLCAPSISAVWHPFTVYHHPSDPTTVRMLFRPIGPFTKTLRSTLLDSTKSPTVLIDAFYRGNDHCQQALMCHDHVSIIAGGVAITPFLSMIYAVLNRLSTKFSIEKANPILRSMTIIWSCRELGLISFLQHTYLHDMVYTANSISDFDLKIKIHYTGTSNLADPIGQIIASQALSFSGTESERSVTVEDEELTDPPNDKDDEDGHLVAPTRTLQHTNVKPRIIEYANKASGHSLELGRMMPARYSTVIWNFPYFLAFTASVWFGFHFMFYPYDYAPSYRDKSEQAYITMLVILFFFGVGIIIEGCVLLFRKYRPSSSDDQLNLVSSLNIKRKEIDAEANNVDRIELPSKSLSHYSGRPSHEDMLVDASRASAPGLFVCGPSGLVKMLRDAVTNENKPFGFLTRYAIYEESFEM